MGPPDLGDIPTFPIEPELYPKSSGGKIISTEGCFSCKVRVRKTLFPVRVLCYRGFFFRSSNNVFDTIACRLTATEDFGTGVPRT